MDSESFMNSNAAFDYLPVMARSNRSGPQKRLDKEHGFLVSIRKQLSRQAAEMNIPPVSPSAHVLSSAQTQRTQEPDYDMCANIEEMFSIADLQSFILDTQSVIRMAIKEPQRLSMSELRHVAQVLVERACEGVGYYDTAAILCSYISQRLQWQQDQSNVPDLRFTSAILEVCNYRRSMANKMRDVDIRYWTNFCLFIGELFLHMKIQGRRSSELRILLFDILKELSSPPHCNNSIEVNALAMIYKQCGQNLCGDDPDNFDDLVCKIRDAFVAGVEKENCCVLLMLIELHTSKWQLSDTAKEYYGLI